MTRRIVITVMTVTIVAVTALFVPAALAIRSARERGDLLELQREASVVADRITGAGTVSDVELRGAVDSKHLVGVYGMDGRRLFGEGPDTADRIVQAALVGNFAEGHVGSDLVAAVPVLVSGGSTEAVLRIEAPGSESRARVLRSLTELAVAGVVIVAAATLAAIMLARRLNRPIDDLRRWAATPSSDPPPPTGIAELDELRGELIADRERISDLLRRERSFSSHVSHQLRTPVAAMRVAIETELEAPRENTTTILGEALGQLDRLESSITGLLALARHDSRPAERVALTDVVRTVVDSLTTAASAVDRDISVHGVEIAVETDRVAIEHIVTVLVDNAIRHGSGSVRVDVGIDDDGIRVDVADGGPSPSPGDVFAEQRTDPGHGIGLRLARTLAESIGGSLVLLDRPSTTFRLRIPDLRPR